MPKDHGQTSGQSGSKGNRNAIVRPGKDRLECKGNVAQ
jgi:hypothetical protein